MNFERRKAISTVAIVAIVVVIIVIAGIAAYYVSTTPSSTTSSTSSTSSLSSVSTTSTTSSTPTSTTSSTSSTSSTSTTTPVSTYGPTNSSILVDESQTTTYDSMDPAYAFNLQDVGMLNAVYQNLVELNGTQGDAFQYVLATSANVNANGGFTTVFQIRPHVWFSNGDNFSSYDVWFSQERNMYMNTPSFIAGFNWNQILYNFTTGGSEYSDSYCWNSPINLGVSAGLGDAVAHVTGLNTNSETLQSCELLSAVVGQMLSNFNPSNATQAAIMAYPNQALVAPNATTFVANYLAPLGNFALELWSGFDGQQVLDPAFVDAHGGVQNNTVNAYINQNGAIGTGPYMIRSVGASFTPITYNAVPDYWGAHSAAIMNNASETDATPAHISDIVFSVPASDTDLIEDFATNRAQLSYETTAEFGQFYNAFDANQPSFAFNQILCSTACGAFPFGIYFLMNQAQSPTNITAFRLAWEYAINYTELNVPNYYNGQAYFTYFVGALTPAFGSLYNPDNYPTIQQNTTAAYNYLSEAGMEGSFYTVVPATFTLSNGTSVPAGTLIGDPNGQQLQPIRLYYTVPLLSEMRAQLSGVINDLQVLGIPATTFGITSPEGDILKGQASTFPQAIVLGWGPDFADPFLAMYEPLLLPGPYNGWYTNQTVISETYKCLFPTGAQVQACAQTLEAMTVQNAIFPPFPNQPTYYFFVQPYVKGMVNNPFVGYWYNQLYYAPQPT